MSRLVTPQEAAKALGVSLRHIKNLISEADAMPKKARWRFGKQIIDLSPVTSVRRTLRINLEMVIGT